MLLQNEMIEVQYEVDILGTNKRTNELDNYLQWNFYP